MKSARWVALAMILAGLAWLIIDLGRGLNSPAVYLIIAGAALGAGQYLKQHGLGALKSNRPLLVGLVLTTIAIITSLLLINLDPCPSDTEAIFCTATFVEVAVIILSSGVGLVALIIGFWRQRT